MSELSKKILESGLVDEATARLMERWGVLEEGSADLAKEAMLKNRGREELIKFADAIEVELDKARKLRETNLDINQMKWPVHIRSIRGAENGSIIGRPYITGSLTAMIDRMGRYYFRPADVQMAWFVPGYAIERDVSAQGQRHNQTEIILEVSELYVGDQVAAIQVSTK